MDIKRIAFAGGTFACAIGIGFFMQQGNASIPVDSVATQQAAVVGTPAVQQIDQPALPVVASVVPDLAPITNVQNTVGLFGSSSNDDTQNAVKMGAELEAPNLETAPVRSTESVDLAEGCEVSLAGKDSRAAMVEVTLTAPCAAGQIATIHHEGMMFSVAINDDGVSIFDVPVLAENALIIAALEGGEGAVLTHSVPTLASYDRVVVQWKGDAGVELHARELGAEYGEPGHVWYGAPRDAGAISYQVGFLKRLGDVEIDQSLTADVYTFPVVTSDHAGTIEISVETEITASNCAKDITAQTIQISPFAERVVHDLDLSLPECDAVGDFIVLALPVQDIQLASR